MANKEIKNSREDFYIRKGVAKYLVEGYGVRAISKKSINELRKFREKSAYVLNKDGDIIGLSLVNDSLNGVFELGKLAPNLEYLSISDNKNLNEITFTTDLDSLTHLDLSFNSLKNVLLPEKGFSKLEHFDFSNNKLKNILLKGEYPSLKFLNGSNNNMEWIKLPDKLDALKYLYLSDNKLRYFENSNNNYNPDYLDIEYALPEIPKVKEINIVNNNLRKIIFRYTYSCLERLDIRENPIEDIGGLEKLFYFEKEFYLYISPSNYLKTHSILVDEDKNAFDTIRNYLVTFIKLPEDGVKQVYLPVKVLILGNHASGKTHLIKLWNEYKELDEDIKSTHFLDVLKLTKEEANNEISLKSSKDKLDDSEKPIAHIYDFGGQDFYHGIYRMFMDSSCLYCFVWRDDKNIKEITFETETVLKSKMGETEGDNSGKEDERKEIMNHPHKYWLEQINYIENIKYWAQMPEENKDSRTILIQSHIDQHHRQFINISTEDNKKYRIIEGLGLMLNPQNDTDTQNFKFSFDFFRNLLINNIEKNRQIQYEPVIELFEFLNDCSSKKSQCQGLNITYGELEKLIKERVGLKNYLKLGRDLNDDLIWGHKTGYILYFPPEKSQDNYVKRLIENKIWFDIEMLVKQFQEIFKKELQDDGIIPFDEFERDYAIDTDLKNLYIKMNLLFTHNPDETPDPKEYIIPNYLPYFKNAPDYELMEYGFGEAIMKIRFEYFIPFGIMSKLITYFGNNPDKKRFWRDAIIFTLKNSIKKGAEPDLYDENKNFKVAVRLDLLRNEFVFHVVHKDNKVILPNEKKRFREYFFKVILRAYYDKDLSDIDYFKEQSYTTKKDKNISGIIGGQDFKRIPEDMYVSLDGKHYISILNLNKDDVKGKFNMNSFVFKDEIKDNKLMNTIIEPSEILVLRQFNEFSRFELGKTLDVVISYSRDDDNELQRLLGHLNPMENSGKISIFYDRRMKSGISFSPELKRRFENADIIISMISPSWANSSYIMKYELPIAIRRGVEGINKGFYHIPFLIKPTNYKEIITMNESGEKIYLKDTNLYTDLTKARLMPASQYTEKDNDPYLIVGELISNIVKNANKSNEKD